MSNSSSALPSEVTPWIVLIATFFPCHILAMTLPLAPAPKFDSESFTECISCNEIYGTLRCFKGRWSPGFPEIVSQLNLGSIQRLSGMVVNWFPARRSSSSSRNLEIPVFEIEWIWLCDSMSFRTFRSRSNRSLSFNSAISLFVSMRWTTFGGIDTASIFFRAPDRHPNRVMDVIVPRTDGRRDIPGFCDENNISKLVHFPSSLGSVFSIGLEEISNLWRDVQ